MQVLIGKLVEVKSRSKIGTELPEKHYGRIRSVDTSRGITPFEVEIVREDGLTIVEWLDGYSIEVIGVRT